MVKQLKYKIKIPIPSSENETSYIEKSFASIPEVATFLKISTNTLYSFRSGRLKCIHSEKKILSGIIIEKLDVEYNGKGKNKEDEEILVEEKKKKYREELQKQITS